MTPKRQRRKNTRSSVSGKRRDKEIVQLGIDPLAEKPMSDNDAALLKQVNLYWVLAEWSAIEGVLTDDALRGHPEAGYLYMILASALMHLNKPERASSCLNLAVSLGVPSKKVKKVFLSGAYHTLGSLYLLKGAAADATDCYEKSLRIADVNEAKISSESRKLKMLASFSMLTEAAEEVDKTLADRKSAIDLNKADYADRIISEQRKIHQFLRHSSIDFARYIKYSDVSTAETLLNVSFDAAEVVDALENLNRILVSTLFSNNVKYELCCFAARRFRELADNVMAVHFISFAKKFATDYPLPRLNFLATLAIEVGQYELAIDYLIEAKSSENGISRTQKDRLIDSYRRMRAASKLKQQHGHDLLLAHLEQNNDLCIIAGRKRRLVEVGTTREMVPGQGSTRLFSEFCVKKNLEFVTVDMDPNNSNLANEMFIAEGMGFKAVTEKGEDYLAQYSGIIDFVFLDAYDFDHGKHSSLRQSRYAKYLGGAIDEQQCHKMHLDCCEALLKCLAEDGLICIDDTWLDEHGNWTAKGTTAVPFLLANGFEIIENRNRAVLLGRVKT